MVMQNPAYKNALEYVQAHGNDPKAAFEQLAREQGLNPDDVRLLMVSLVHHNRACPSCSAVDGALLRLLPLAAETAKRRVGDFFFCIFYTTYCITLLTATRFCGIMAIGKTTFHFCRCTDIILSDLCRAAYTRRYLYHTLLKIFGFRFILLTYPNPF